MPEKSISARAFMLTSALSIFTITACGLVNIDIVNNHEIRGMVGLCAGGLDKTELVIHNKIIGEKRIFADAEGNYSFTDVEDGTYTITPSKEGYLFTPSTREVTMNRNGIANQDFITIITFSKKYFEEYEARGFSVEQTPDCGYIIAGYINRETAAAADYDWLVMKLDQYGEIEWSKESKDFGASDGFDSAYSVAVSGTEGYVITGDRYGGSAAKTDTFIKKMNAAGDAILWTAGIANPSFDHGRQVINIGTGFVGIGFTDSPPTAGLFDFMIYSVNADGTGLSSRVHGSANIDKGCAIAAYSGSGGGYIMAGDMTYYSAGLASNLFEGKLIDVNSNFTERKRNTFKANNVNNISEFSDVCVTPGGSYISVGRTKLTQSTLYDMWLLKVNSGLDKENEIIIDRGFHDGFNVIRNTSDTGFIAGGYSQRTLGGGSEIVIIKFNADGEIEWEMPFPGSLSGNDEATSMQQTHDGGFAVLGVSQTNESRDYIRLIKTDKDGKRLNEYE